MEMGIRPTGAFRSLNESSCPILTARSCLENRNKQTSSVLQRSEQAPAHKSAKERKRMGVSDPQLFPLLFPVVRHIIFDSNDRRKVRAGGERDQIHLCPSSNLIETIRKTEPRHFISSKHGPFRARAGGRIGKHTRVSQSTEAFRVFTLSFFLSFFRINQSKNDYTKTYSDSVVGDALTSHVSTLFFLDAANRIGSDRIVEKV